MPSTKLTREAGLILEVLRHFFVPPFKNEVSYKITVRSKFNSDQSHVQ
jgi:hypothetical protein